MMLARARRILHCLGIDQAVGFTLLGHGWNAASGPILLGLIVVRLTLSEQGVLFNYIEISQYRFVFELGSAVVLQQMASRERAFLMIGADGTLTGDPEAKARLAVLLRLAVRWFLAVAALTIVVLFPIGWFMFDRRPDLANVDWQLPWFLSVISAAGFGFAVAMFLFIAGCGDVLHAARMVALRDFISSIGLALFFLIGLKLYAHPFSGFVGMLVPLGFFFGTRRRMLVDLWKTKSEKAALSWRKEIWPFQWPLALSWLCTDLLLLYLFSQVALNFFSASVAGQVGLSVYIMIALRALGMSWVGTKIPGFGQLIALKKWVDLDHQFRAVLIRSTAFLGLLLSLVVAGNFVLYNWEGSIFERWTGSLLGPRAVEFLREPGEPGGPPRTQSLVEPVSLALLAFSFLVMHVVNTMTAYLRAHRREAMLPALVPLGLAVALTLLLAGLDGDVRTMFIGYAFWVLVLGSGVGSWIFFRCRRRWHA